MLIIITVVIHLVHCHSPLDLTDIRHPEHQPGDLIHCSRLGYRAEGQRIAYYDTSVPVSGATHRSHTGLMLGFRVGSGTQVWYRSQVLCCMQRDHPDEPVAVKIIGKEAGEKWKSMSMEEKEPYETLSTASKQEYARMKQLTPAERVMLLAAQAMHHPVSLLLFAYGTDFKYGR